MLMDELFEAAKRTGRKAGSLIRELEEDRAVISSEGKDIKTIADKESEACIIDELSQYNIPFLTEESGRIGTTEYSEEGYWWIIDPLDGTFNFTKGFKEYCVSIALWKRDEPIFGVIYHIPDDILYSGMVGVGAWKDDVRISGSGITEKKKAILATGFPVAFDYSNEAISSYIDNVKKYKKIRMIGSAALSLAYVAEGVFDAYSEENIYLWDIAAGIAIVKASGGIIQGNSVLDRLYSINVFSVRELV